MSVLASKTQNLPTLASQPLPRHVRDLLKSTLSVLTDGLSGSFNTAFRDFEQSLYRQTERAMGKDAQARWMQVQDMVVHSRADMLLHFFNALEAELASLQDPQVKRGHLQAGFSSGDVLALVNDLEIEETSVLTDAATRAELQNSLQLFLLGQRFGVLAGRPAFDVELLPVGPQALCRSARRATEQLGLDVDFRLAFYRAFDRQVMGAYAGVVEAVNADLARNGVLPSLQYVPVRARRTLQNPETSGPSPELGDHGLSLLSAGDQKSARGELRSRGGGSSSPAQVAAAQARVAADMLIAMAQGAKADATPQQGYDLLRQLMGSRRQLLGKLNADRTRGAQEAARVVSADDVQAALRGMQHRPASGPVLSQGGRTTIRNVGHLKQDMLALLRRVSPGQQAPALSDEHNDALDLVGMLYDNLMKDLKPGSTASTMLTKLQVPLMRVALKDSGFFTQADHPARQMLGTIADTGLHWLGDDDSEGGLSPQMHSIIDRAVHEYQDDPDLFRNVLQEVITHLQGLSRKAEVAERRHVEAARGKEKLTLAREHAATCVDSLVKNQKLPRFTRTMLSQAWTDVMALTSLRHGADSIQWQRQLQVAEQLIDIARHPDGSAGDSPQADEDLKREIEDGLSKVGYQGEDVHAIAHRLVYPNAAALDESSSRTELTMRLKAQARLGEELPGKRGRRVPLTSAEAAHMERIQQTPAGTWFEFVTNPHGDRARRRLSWLSTATGNALFVNQRGQKNAEYTLESLARLMGKGQVSIVEDDKMSSVDRAWESVLTALRSFAVPEPGQGEGGAASTPDAAGPQETPR